MKRMLSIYRYSYRRINVLHRKSKQVNHYTPKSCNLTDENVYAILPGDNNTLLLGTLNGSYYLIRKRKNFIRFRQIIKAIKSKTTESLYYSKTHRNDYGLEVKTVYLPTRPTELF